MSTQRVVVVGGANTDIVGHSFGALIERDSNPGYVRLSAGGVGRNIAENLARLGASVELITALGGDHNAEQLAQRCRQTGVGVDLALVVPELPGSLYIAILDEGGDMALALNDMRALDRLTPSVLAERTEALQAADLVVLDANPDPESLEWIADAAQAPLLLDPVSASKAPRALGILGRLAALKCNAMEAGALLGSPTPRGVLQVEEAASGLLLTGVSSVYITAGPSGVHYASEAERGWVAAPRVGVANATGAGDAFCAGVGMGILDGLSPRSCASLGTVLAGFALASEHTVSERVTRQAALSAMEELDA